MVSSQTISNCWKKTGILPQSDELEEVSDDNDSVFSDRYKFFKFEFFKYF